MMLEQVRPRWMILPRQVLILTLTLVGCKRQKTKKAKSVYIKTLIHIH